MSAIIGILHLDTSPLDPTVPARMVESLAHRGPDAQGTWCQEGVGLGHGMLWTTPESLNERQPLCSQDNTLTLVSDARIDNREELISTLALSTRPISQITDAELILAAYQKWGKECPLRLLGDFAFAIWDKNRRELFCARDPVGVKSFYYHHRSRLFAFASEIKALFEIPEIPRELNEQRVADHLIFVFDDQASTFYREIYRLPASHCMTVSTRGLKIRRYWMLDSQHELTLGSDAEYEEAFREVFTESVRCRLRSAFPVGSTLSGGLDSSSITCIARNCLKQESRRALHTFSAIFPSLPEADLRRIDERSYVQAVLAGGDLVAHEVRADQLNPLGDLKDILWYQDDPLVPFNLYMHLGIYRTAREQGARVILDGFDGDTTLSHGYEYLAELARKLRWRRLLKEARAVSQRSPNRFFSPWKVIWIYALSPLVPANVMQCWNRIQVRHSPPWGHDSVISKDFARTWNLEERVRKLESRSRHFFASARELHLQGLESPLIPYVLELVDKSAAACSLEARYPYFDRRLMEFCLSLPAEQKLRAGWSRSILRRAMQGILPPQIQWRDSKANLSPNFCRNLLNMGRETLDRIFVEDIKAIEQFIDVVALNRLYQRYTKRPSNTDAMTLFVAVTFVAWMRQNGFIKN